MTVSPYASDAKISEALAAIGAELVGQTEQQLLQQILVAAATASGGGSGGSVAFSAITGSPTDNTNLAAALNAKLNLTGGTLTGPVLIADGSAAAPSLMTAASSASRIGFYGTAQSLILSAYGNAQFAFASPFNGSALSIHSTATLEWTATSSPISAPDVIFGRGGAAATLQLGRNHATTPTAQVLKAHNVTTGTGADISIRGGTGSIADGYVRLGTATGGLAFFGTGGRVQSIGDINTNVSSVGWGDTVLVDTQFDGGSGNSYTIGGIVKVLKEYGILG